MEVKQEEVGVAKRADVPAPIVVQELSVDDVTRQVDKIQVAMRDCMKENVHYGVIPGTQKPSLLQPGAEKLCLMFRLAPEYTVDCQRDAQAERHWTKTKRNGETYSGDCKGFVRYTVNCRLSHGPTGTLVASGVGTANNWEPKFISRDPYEVEETVIQFARKRALVNAVRTGTAASDIFTQDVEDIPPEVLKEHEEPAAAKDGGIKAPPETSTRAAGSPVCPKCGAEAKCNIGQKTKSGKDKPAWTCSTAKWTPQDGASGCDWKSYDTKFFDAKPAAEPQPPPGALAQSPDGEPPIEPGQKIRIDNIIGDYDIVFNPGEKEQMIQETGCASGKVDDMTKAQAQKFIQALNKIAEE